MFATHSSQTPFSPSLVVVVVVNVCHTLFTNTLLPFTGSRKNINAK